MQAPILHTATATLVRLAKLMDAQHKTAWFMFHRIRLAMQDKTPEKLSGQVEADETYIGGSARFIHKKVRGRKIKGQTGGVQSSWAC